VSQGDERQVGWEFFVSYTQADRAWAEWIAWVLEEDGHKVLVQAWDFVPGSNWIENMHVGTRDADRTVVVLSPDYLGSLFGGAEWQAAWAQDPAGAGRKLLVVRVRECDRPGLLAGVVSTDVFGLSEAEARARLRAMVAAAVTGRAKPTVAPGFPGGGRAVAREPRFPGALPRMFNTARNLTLHKRAVELSRQTFAITEQGQVTDRYFKAIDQLGSDKLDVRIGGIYALERIAHDSPRDHPTVFEVLATFVREHSSEQWPLKPEGEPGTNLPDHSTRPDVQAVMNVIGRREVGYDNGQIDLSRVNLIGADLRNAKLARAIMTAANLTRANLAGADLKGAELVDAILVGANVSRAAFAPAQLVPAGITRADVRNAMLAGPPRPLRLPPPVRPSLVENAVAAESVRDDKLVAARIAAENSAAENWERAKVVRPKIVRTNLTGANLSGANLTGADFLAAQLERAVFVGANLSGADFTVANLYKADLTRAELANAILTRAELGGAKLTGAKLTQANLVGARLAGAALGRVELDSESFFRPLLVSADLTDANLTRAYLYRTNFTGARLIDANLTRADLTRANLKEANLYGANLTDAELNEAVLVDAHLEDATLLRTSFLHANLSGARFPDAVELPAGWIRDSDSGELKWADEEPSQG
jgi:uncharacterized protein YjbI with pentapeptide repeats